MSAFEAMLDSLFSDPNMAVDGVLRIPQGLTRKCRVLFTRASDNVAGSLVQLGANAEHDTAEVLVSEVPQQPPRGSRLAIGRRQYKLGSPAVPECDGLTWRLTLSDPDDE